MRRVYTVRCGGIDVCFCTLQPFFPRRFRRPPLCFFSEYTVYSSTYASASRASGTARLVPSDDGSSATEASRHRLGHRSPGITDMPRAKMPVPLPALPSKATVTPCTTARTPADERYGWTYVVDWTAATESATSPAALRRQSIVMHGPHG